VGDGVDLERSICEEHASEAAFLWALRDRAVVDATYDRASVAELDERVEAHIDGLRLAETVGWECALEALDEGPDGGAAFVSTVLALERGYLKGFARVLDRAAEDSKAARGIVSAMGWIPFTRVRPILPGLLAGRCPAPMVWLGIAGCAVHRQDPGHVLGYALVSSSERVRARALRAVGELGRADHIADLRVTMTDPSEVCRYWAAWSAALFGEAKAADVLWAFAAGGGAFAERAAAMAMRRMDPRTGLTWLYALAGMADGMRPALAGAGALGEPTIVPWVLDAMKTPEAARLAGLSFSMITGLDLAEEKLVTDRPEGFVEGPSDDSDDDDVEMDPDDGLPWPDPVALEGWWKREGRRFQKGTRYLLGKPMAEAGWLDKVLVTGHQVARASAAVEMVIAGRRKGVVEVRGAASAFR